MSENNDVLKKLLSDDNDIDANELFKLLSPLIKISKSTKNIIFLETAQELPVKQKILLYILGKKVLFLLEEIESDHIRPKDIIRDTGIPRGSILPALKELRELKGGGLISSDGAGYYITVYQLSKIKSKKVLDDNDKDK